VDKVCWLGDVTNGMLGASYCRCVCTSKLFSQLTYSFAGGFNCHVALIPNGHY